MMKLINFYVIVTKKKKKEEPSKSVTMYDYPRSTDQRMKPRITF